MNILYLCTDPGIPIRGTKGAAVHVRSLVSAFTRAGHSVSIVAPLLIAELSDPPAPVDAHILHLPPGRGITAAMDAVQHYGDRLGVASTVSKELRRILYNEEIESRVAAAIGDSGIGFVYERATVYGTAGVAVARRLRVPLVVELNAPLAIEQSTYRGISFPELAREAEGYTLRNADVVLTVSAPLRDYAVSLGAAARRVHVMANGVDADVFTPAPASQALRERWGVGAGPVIGFVGGLRPWHGVGALPALVARLARRHPGVQLVIAGDGPLRGSLIAACASHGVADRVRFTGAVGHDEIAPIVRMFDVALAPYDATDQPFYFSPLKLFEYMACGVAVVAASLGQISEVIRDGEDGLLYAAGDEDALASACERLLGDPGLRSRLGRAAAAAVRQRFSWRRNADAVVGLVESLSAAPEVA